MTHAVPLECLADATCSRGLTALFRRRPRDAHELLRRVGAGRSLRRDITVGRWLRTGADGSLLPEDAVDQTFRPRRAASARWLPYVDTLCLADVDERRLRAVVRERLAEQVSDSKELWLKDCNWLRAWIYNGQCAIDVEPQVAAAWTRIPVRPDMTSGRDALDLPVVRRLLLACVPKLDLAVAIGLAVGSGLTVAEIVRLRHRDLDLVGRTVRVVTGSRRGAPGRECSRVAGLPPWVVDLVRVGFARAPDPEGWLFPMPGHPGRHVNRLDGRLRRVAERAGEEAATMEGLRRVHQGVLRVATATRAATRGRVLGGASRVPTEAQAKFRLEHQAITDAWKRLMTPPFTPGHVPRRAPKGCRPLQPELEAARARVRWRTKSPLTRGAMRGLPPSCLTGPQRDEVATAVEVDSPVLRMLRSDLAKDGPLLAERTAQLAEKKTQLAQLREVLVAMADVMASVPADVGPTRQELEGRIDLLQTDLDAERRRVWEAFLTGGVSGVAATQAWRLLLGDPEYGPKVRSVFASVGLGGLV